MVKKYNETYKEQVTALFPEDEAIQEQIDDTERLMKADRKTALSLSDKAIKGIADLKGTIEAMSKLRFEGHLPSIGEYGGGTEKALELLNLLLSCFEKKRVSLLRMQK